MDLKRLRYFCTIVEQKSISGAARKLFIAQPPLSKRLQELEEEIGTPLVVRTGRQIEPTEAGHYLYLRACEILRTVEEVRQKTIAVATSERRLLRVGVSYLFSRHFFPLVRELFQQNPRAEISISVSDSSHLETLLQKGLIDIAFIQRPNTPEGLDLVEFPRVGMAALVPRSLRPPQAGESVTLADIGNHPLILMRRVEGPGTFETILDQLRKAGIHPDVKMHVSDPSIAIEMLESGVEAVVFLPESEAAPSRNGKFDTLRIFPSPLIFAPVMARLSTSTEMPEICKIVSDFCRQSS